MKSLRLFYFRNLNYLTRIINQNMSTFVSRISPVTGKQEWIVQDDNYDYQQEIARSAYADMLHDTERNQKYYVALKDAIRLMHSKGLEANVLDIGTGTGLLSMMAVSCGADSVTACEAFHPMATCAKQVIRDNGFADRIRIIPKRSTEMTVGLGGDMAARANILVTEVFDTELIGEGAIGTFHHAHERLLQRDSIVVPSAANMYVQVVQSDLANRWNQFQPVKSADGSAFLRPPAEICRCPGAAAVHDLQLEQVSCDWFQPITEPIHVFRFDYSGKPGAIKFRDSRHVAAQAISTGDGGAIFMWWDLEMDTKNKVLLSCAPGWAHPNPSELQWRDHWMQAVYYPTTPLALAKGESFVLRANHDDYSLWFDLSTSNNNIKNKSVECPVCSCGAHIACSRSRIGLLNDQSRNQKFISALEKVVKPSTVCLSISDGSLLPLMAAKLGAKKVYALETSSSTRRMVESYIHENKLDSVIEIVNKRPEELLSEHLDNNKVDLLIGEPYFTTTTLPWHNLCYWYSRTELEDVLADGAMVLPWRASLKAVAVDFDDLWKIRAPVGNCEGFDLTQFDKLIESASDRTDAYMEPHPLWEYPGYPLTDEFDILNLDFSRPLIGIKVVEREGFIEILSSGTCNGVAVWMDYNLDKDTRVTTGLLESPQFGQKLKWDIHTRQAVHLFKNPRKIDFSNGNTKKWRLKHKLVFKPRTGELDIEFTVLST